jgi:hypothetical protein
MTARIADLLGGGREYYLFTREYYLFNSSRGYLEGNRKGRGLRERKAATRAPGCHNSCRTSAARGGCRDQEIASERISAS